MPGFKRRQTHLVSHYTRNDFSRLLVSRHAALGRVSKVSIQNSSCFTHSLFPLERNSGRLFSTWTCVSSNKAHYLCRCQKFLWLGTYYYHKNKRSPWRALMFLPHLQNVWFKKIHRKPCETATDFAFLYSLQLECISLGVCFLFIWIAHPLSMNSIKGRWEGEQCQQDNGTQHSSPFLSDSLICWLNITIASSPLFLDGSLNKN